MDEAELNSLVSPCKRLKLLSPGKLSGHGKAEGTKPDEPAPSGAEEDTQKDIKESLAGNVMDGIEFIDDEGDSKEMVISTVEELLDIEKERNCVEEKEKVEDNDGKDKGSLNNEPAVITSDEEEDAQALVAHIVNGETTEITARIGSLGQNRIFCLTGEPVPSEEVRVESDAGGAEALIEKIEETSSSQQEPNVYTRQVNGVEERKGGHEHQAVHLVMLETDLDATLTNDNIEIFNMNGANPETGEEDSLPKDGNEKSDPVDDKKEENPSNGISPKYPLEPAVTILPVSIKKWLIDETDDRLEHYPVLTTFKPQSNRPTPELVRPDIIDGGSSCSSNKGSNSVPLLTSTPVVKNSQGLKVRDMNIMRTENQKDNKIIKYQKNIEELYDVENVQRNVYVGENERNIVNVKNAVNSKVGNKKVEEILRLKTERESKREKKKMKGTRIQKFKEYVGPGLTTDLSTESDTISDPSKKDFVKNTDIQTCTLTEYKGFGLTGPLPDKPLMASTPLPSSGPIANPNVLNAGPSMSNVGPRPAGTEGMILSNFDQKPQMLQAVCAVAKDSIQTSNNESSGSNIPFIQKGSCSGQQSLTDHSAQCHSGASSALQPDDVYPGHGSGHEDRSENNSNTDKSDKIEKLFDPKVLQCNGK